MQATEQPGELSRERVVAFIDIGTNSIRMFIVRLFPNCTYNVLSRQKETVRLGDGEFRDDRILDTAIDRAVTVCRNFTGLARSFSTDEIVAVATSAAREAKNRNVLLNRLRHEASIDVRVISGRDEARLIYMGVVTGIHLGEQQAVFIDIGGGSTEIAIGGQHTSCHLESLLLGSIRLTNLFFTGNEEKPVTKKKYERIREHVRSVIEPALPGLRSHHFDTAIGSLRHHHQPGGDRDKNWRWRIQAMKTDFRVRELSRVAEMLCSLPLSLRRKVPGINPERGDLIICGAAILETLMDALQIDRIVSTNRGLQDGLLADYLTRMEDFPLIGSLSVRERSVLQLARSCGINEHHARTVARLAQELFTSARGCGLHAYAGQEEELLVYATFLHDVGSFISYNNHHLHSHYLIKNSDLSGFIPREILLMASLARYHRKRPPEKKDPLCGPAAPAWRSGADPGSLRISQDGREP